MKNKHLLYRVSLIITAVIILSGCSGKFEIINPYQDVKPFPYKASFHNHTRFHPEYMHASRPVDMRLRDYRDYQTEPQYGIVSITDHNRVTAPWNTIPSGTVAGTDAPWGVEGILWIPGNETVIGNHTGNNQQNHPDGIGDLRGEMLVINASTGQTNEKKWIIREHPETRSGLLYTSDELPASVELTFTGTGIEWIACREPGGGIAAIYLNNEIAGEANLYAPEETCNHVVFKVENLNIGEHMLQIVYQSKGESENRDNGKLNMDMLVVTGPAGNITEYPANSSAVSYQPYKYKHVEHYRKGSMAEESLKMFSQDGCFLVLAHPNSRLVTEGEHTGQQLWTSSGYTFAELDILFGNYEKGIPQMSHTPHALEIGNRGYDFSARTGFRNAEEKWDYLLKQGHRIMGVATDDSHGSTPFEGWTVVYTKAETREQLTVQDVMESLLSGNFYASQGPNIRIELDGNRFTIHADKPSLIEFISDGEVVHHTGNALKATYNIQGDEVYVRGRVTREDPEWRSVEEGIGRRRSAWTNPLYITDR